MGSVDNSLRRKWQDYSGRNAANAEHSFVEVFEMLFDQTEYEIVSQPTDFKKLYVGIPLSDAELSEIYNPDKGVLYHGVQPDCLIRNTQTGKSIIVELKRQDGWVEGKKRSDGRGNAHERLCKYFTPGLLKEFRRFCGLGDDVYPFWVVFQGDITRDPCRVREIRFWFNFDPTNLFFWRDNTDPTKLIDHFENYIKPIIG